MRAFTRGLALLLAATLLLSFTACGAIQNILSGTRDTVVLGAVPVNEDTWYLSWLRQEGIVTETVNGANITIGMLNDIFDRALAYVANAAGQPNPGRRNYWDGLPEVIDHEVMYGAVNALRTDCEAYNPQADGAENQRLVVWQGEAVDIDHIFSGVATICKTESYIANLNPAYYEQRGMDFLNEWYDPARLGLPVEALDELADYDFDRVAMLEDQLSGVDRSRALSALFNLIVGDSPTSQDRQMKVLRFLTRSGYHNVIQPLHEDGGMVEDPLLILELGEMNCGHVARLACDLFATGGYRNRLVQAGYHVLAEIYYEDDWHYLDADQTFPYSVFAEDGTIPSMVELSHTPQLIDSLGCSFWPMDEYRGGRNDGVKGYYRSPFYFGRHNYTTPPQYYEKSATPAEMLNQRYGWDRVNTVPDDERLLYDGMGTLWLANSPVLEDITQNGDGGHTISWKASAVGGDGTLAGYRVYVGSNSRGWDWDIFYAPDKLMSYRSLPGYDPANFEQLYQPLPDDVAVMQLGPDETSVAIPAQDSQVFVSIVALDAHGLEAENQFFFPSNEIRLPG